MTLSRDRSLKPKTDLWSLENDLFHKGSRCIAGMDEAGRGPLAGPVVAAAVTCKIPVSISGVQDSKKLGPGVRARLYREICDHEDLDVGIGQASVEEIDSLNIFQASMLAFSRAFAALSVSPDFCLIDGNKPCPLVQVPQQAVVKGDQISFLIAAASIIAKETRDAIMHEHHHRWPQFGFARHKGYATALHKAAIQKHGYCKIHRKSFEPVKSLASPPPPSRHEDHLPLFPGWEEQKD